LAFNFVTISNSPISFSPNIKTMEDQLQKLELRITELENKLKQGGAAAGSSNVDPEELKTYQKVSAQLLQITCYICRVCWHCWPPLCICPCGPGYHCTPCGPCIQSGGAAGSAGFSDFMK
jgi:nitrate reductase beta subunit